MVLAFCFQKPALDFIPVFIMSLVVKSLLPIDVNIEPIWNAKTSSFRFYLTQELPPSTRGALQAWWLEYSGKWPMDCVTSGWTSWGQCSGAAPCSQTRRRTILQKRREVLPAVHGGRPCPLLLEESQQCKSSSCAVGEK